MLSREVLAVALVLVAGCAVNAPRSTGPTTIAGPHGTDAWGRSIDIGATGETAIAWESRPGPRYQIARYSADGQRLWSSSLSPPDCATPTATTVRLTPDGGVVAAVANGATGPLCLQRFAASGKLAWSITIPDSRGIPRLAVTPAGNLFVVGVHNHDGRPPFVTALGKDGATIWRHDLAMIPKNLVVGRDGVVTILGQSVDRAGKPVNLIPASLEVDSYQLVQLTAKGAEAAVRPLVAPGAEEAGLSMLAVNPAGALYLAWNAPSGNYSSNSFTKWTARLVKLSATGEAWARAESATTIGSLVAAHRGLAMIQQSAEERTSIVMLSTEGAFLRRFDVVGVPIESQVTVPSAMIQEIALGDTAVAAVGTGAKEVDLGAAGKFTTRCQRAPRQVEGNPPYIAYDDRCLWKAWFARYPLGSK